MFCFSFRLKCLYYAEGCFDNYQIAKPWENARRIRDLRASNLHVDLCLFLSKINIISNHWYKIEIEIQYYVHVFKNFFLKLPSILKRLSFRLISCQEHKMNIYTKEPLTENKYKTRICSRFDCINTSLILPRFGYCKRPKNPTTIPTSRRSSWRLIGTTTRSWKCY